MTKNIINKIGKREMKVNKGRALEYEEIFVKGKPISPHTPRVPCSNFPNSISQIQFSPNDVIDNVITHHELLLIKSPKHHVYERKH